MLSKTSDIGGRRLTPYPSSVKAPSSYWGMHQRSFLSTCLDIQVKTPVSGFIEYNFRLKVTVRDKFFNSPWDHLANNYFCQLTIGPSWFGLSIDNGLPLSIDIRCQLFVAIS